jgi:hypothetical protein
MRRFIDIITENAVPQFLYHGTSLYNLVRIIDEDAMIAHADDEDTEAVFATDRYSRAKDYGDGVIVFDTHALRTHTFVAPHSYYLTPTELEFVIGATDGEFLRPITAFIHEIIVQRHDLEALQISDQEKAHSESEWNNAFNYDGNGEERWQAAVEKFLSFPKLRIE